MSDVVMSGAGFAQENKGQKERNKALIWRFWQELEAADAAIAGEHFAAYVHQNIAWYGLRPIGDLSGREAVLDNYWRPFKHSFPDLQRKTAVLLGGRYKETDWVAASGHFTGTFAHDWLGIPATGQETIIRFGEIMAVQEGQITRTYFLADLLDVMQQGGFALPLPSPAPERLRILPSVADGVLLAEQDPAESRISQLLIEAMLFGLIRKDMPMASYWDPHMIWNGPSGIGTARSLQEFDDLILHNFRLGLTGQWGGDHNARFADGRYGVSTGWPSLVAAHDGHFLGCPPTGNRLEWHIMDFWERKEDLLYRNWVHIDMIDVFSQMGVDIFAMLQMQREQSG